MPRIMANLTGLCPDVGGTPAATWPCPWAEMRGGVGIGPGEGRFFGRNVRTNQDGDMIMDFLLKVIFVVVEPSGWQITISREDSGTTLRFFLQPLSSDMFFRPLKCLT